MVKMENKQRTGGNGTAKGVGDTTGWGWRRKMTRVGVGDTLRHQHRAGADNVISVHRREDVDVDAQELSDSGERRGKILLRVRIEIWG